MRVSFLPDRAGLFRGGIRAAAAALLLSMSAAPAQSAAPVLTQSAAPAAATATAIFAAGCFWCVEEAFDKVDGVVETTSGYTGGTVADPSYEQVAGGRTGHAEAVLVRYDPAEVRYEDLLDTFWRNVDMFDPDGQFCDRGSPYRSGIHVSGEEQMRLAEASKERISKRFGKPVVTPIVPAGPFYPAEAYHQDYYEKNPLRYSFYKWNCGRAQRLEALWGADGKPSG